MVHITLSIPEEVHREMKKHPEIKWSEVARRTIIEKTQNLKTRLSSSELLASLPLETQKGIAQANDKEAAMFARKVREAGAKRKRYLTPV